MEHEYDSSMYMVAYVIIAACGGVLAGIVTFLVLG